MFTSLSASLVLVLCGWLQPEIKEFSRELIVSLHFDRTVLHGMLGYLLFAGALHVNINDLYANRWAIASLATVGTILSTGIVASLTWLVTLLLGIDLPVIYCLLFGALISPTDPIAVLGILKSARIPRSLEAKFSGESLFNDGIGVVLFLLLLESVNGRRTETDRRRTHPSSRHCIFYPRGNRRSPFRNGHRLCCLSHAPEGRQCSS